MTYSADNGPLQLKIALLGNPCSFPEWSEEQLQGLVAQGFNAIQLNIAWLRRPNDEALNLCDVVTVAGEREDPRVAERREELLRRNELARQCGLRTLFHFGSPFMWRNPQTGQTDRFATHDYNEVLRAEDPWYETLNPKVTEHEFALLREFRRQFPDVDDILVYTFDQDTWKPSEFSNARLSRGIPLHKRLPPYVAALHQIWTAGREHDAMMWWEPWELSAGQIYKCLPPLAKPGFGLMLHNNIAEAQLTRPVDVWFRNTARMARDLNIPVIGEGFFCSMTEEIEPLSIPCPRLVDEELAAITSVPGVVGIKEYFGLLPLEFDLNLKLTALRLANPEAPYEELVGEATAVFGELQPRVLELLKQLADAMQFFPWDASWFARLAGTADPDHGWSGATVRGQMVETPSWESTRRSHFMMTEDHQPHPFLLEDVQLRCEMAVDCLQAALKLIAELEAQDAGDLPLHLHGAPPPATSALSSDSQGGAVQTQSAEVLTLHDWLSDVERNTVRFLRVTRSYALHLRQTNVAMLLREDLQAGRPMTDFLLKELAGLLESDMENQGHQGRVVTMYNRFKENPEKFIREQLVPTEKTILEKGYHTMTTR